MVIIEPAIMSTLTLLHNSFRLHYRWQLQVGRQCPNSSSESEGEHLPDSSQTARLSPRMPCYVFSPSGRHVRLWGTLEYLSLR